jgi:hypothetical protein
MKTYPQEIRHFDAEKTARKYSFSLKQITIIGAAFLLVVIFLFVWKSEEIKSVKNAYNLSQVQLIDSTQSQIEKSKSNFLNLLGKAYAWAVTDEMMKQNLPKVNSYGNDLVKEKNFLSIMVTDDRGTILSSTDKNFEGVDFRTFSSPYYLNVDSPVVHRVNDSLLVVASPLMNYKGKIGTVIIRYRLTPPSLMSTL